MCSDLQLWDNNTLEHVRTGNKFLRHRSTCQLPLISLQAVAYRKTRYFTKPSDGRHTCICTYKPWSLGKMPGLSLSYCQWWREKYKLQEWEQPLDQLNCPNWWLRLQLPWLNARDCTYERREWKLIRSGIMNWKKTSSDKVCYCEKKWKRILVR